MCSLWKITAKCAFISESLRKESHPASPTCITSQFVCTLEIKPTVNHCFIVAFTGPLPTTLTKAASGAVIQLQKLSSMCSHFKHQKLHPGWWLHAVDMVVVYELLEVLQVVPPLEEEGLCDKAEPGCNLQFLALCLLQHLLQLLLAHITVGFDLIGVWIQLHVLWRDVKKKMLLTIM